MQDVARVAGVSPKTVSNVMNDHPHVSAQTRARVEAAITQLGYQMNVAARSLRLGRSGVLGLALPKLSVTYFAELAEQVIAAAEEEGLVVVIEQTGSIEREHALFSSARLKHLDGLIFNPIDATSDERVRSEDLGDMPVVLLGDHQIGATAWRVSTDQPAAARAATTHLIDKGCHRILTLGNRVGDTAQLRLAGYRTALAERGLDFDPELVADAPSWDRRSGAEVAAAALKRGVKFDGIFAFNDALAFGAMRALQDAGLNVPRDVAVIGFDNLDDAQFSVPSLTSVDPGRGEIARAAVELLVGRIRNGEGQPEVIRPPFQLIERESTAR